MAAGSRWLSEVSDLGPRSTAGSEWHSRLVDVEEADQGARAGRQILVADWVLDLVADWVADWVVD